MGLSLDPIIDFQINIIKIVWQTVMRIVKEILGVKGLKAYKQLIAAKKYIEWLPNTLDFNFYLKMTLLPTDLGISIRNFKNRFAPPQPHTNYFKRWFSYSMVLGCGTANLMICVLQFPLGPRCTAQILVYFAKISVISSVTGVPSEFFPAIGSLTNI